jgi:hypothetical protein
MSVVLTRRPRHAIVTKSSVFPAGSRMPLILPGGRR